jgi:tetratricopeptide (TPR) repeat protein
VTGAYRVAHLDDLDRIEVAGGQYRPIRRRLGVRAFGINAYTAVKAGDQLVERHTEGAGGGSGRQEELYMVLSGHAEFMVVGETVDAPAGTMVFVPDVDAERSAVAKADNTTVLVVGGPADSPIPTSPFEYSFAAEAPYMAGDYARAVEVASEGLAEWPESAQLNYQLACFHALAGHREKALEHLAIALANDPRVAEWASDDTDLDSIRDDPVFPSAEERGRR